MELENRNGRSMTIHKLPSEVQSALRSGIVITSMTQCVVELVLNAIDAGATSIAVRVNFKFHKIQVIDNGCGMNSTNLDLIGTRYMTSKCHSLEDLHNHLDQFGFRGEALASLREVTGLFTMESRPKDSDITYCKVFTHGKPQKAGVSKTMRPGQGTTITVHDFMYNMPVRRQRIRSAIDLEEIKSHIECIAIMQPQISFSLRNDTDGNLILHTRKCADTVGAFSCLFGQAVAQTLVPASSTLGQFKISGYIGKEAHHQKNLQFLYVNKRLILKTKLHKLVNSMLGNSFIMRTNATSRDIPISKDVSAGRWLAFSPPRKRDKYAVYLLNIECPYHIYDICLDPKKTLIEFCDWDKVLQCMESAIRTFLEKEYPLSLSQESNFNYLKEKGSDNNIPSLLKEMGQLEKEYTLGQLRARHEQNEMLNQEKNLDTHDLSENVTKKMLNVSRAVFGMPAKRMEKNEANLSSPGTAQPLEEIDVESEIAVVLDSGTNTSNNNVLADFAPSHILDVRESENPFFSSDTYSETQQHIMPLSVLKSNARHISRRNLNNSISGLSEVPIIEYDCEELSAESSLTKTDPDLHPVVRFRNFINRRIHSKYEPRSNDVPPIVKFRKSCHCISNIESPMSLKNFGQDAFQQYLSTSEFQKKGVNTTNKCDESNFTVSVKDVTVDGYVTAQRNLQKIKGASSILSSKLPTNLKHLIQEIVKKLEDRSVVCKETYNKGHDNHNQYIDCSLQDASKTVSNISVAKHFIENENTGKTKTDTIHCSTGFRDNSVRTKGERNACSSSRYRGHSCNESNIPPREIIEVEESVEFQFRDNLRIPRQNQKVIGVPTTNNVLSAATNVLFKDCMKTSHIACKEHLSNTQHNYSTHENTGTNINKLIDRKDMLPLTQNNKQVYNQLKRTHPKINVCDCYTKICSTDNKSSRDFCTSSDFLRPLKTEKAKKRKCTAQNSFSNNQTTNFHDEYEIAMAASSHEESHNIQGCNKSVRFSSIDNRFLNHELRNNFQGNTVQLFGSLNVLHNESVLKECVRPSLGAVMFRFSPKVEMRYQPVCRNILSIFSSDSSVACDEKSIDPKNMQHLEYVENHCVNNNTKGIPQIVLVSENAVSKQKVGKSMILSSGNEADAECSTDFEPCARKRRRVNLSSFKKSWISNGRFCKHTSNPEGLHAQTEHSNTNLSEESLKRKICHSIRKCENWKLNLLSKEQHNDGTCTYFQEQERIVEYFPSDGQGNMSRVDDKCSQVAIDETVSQIRTVTGVEEDSNYTIVPSSGRSCNSPLAHLNRTPNHKMVVSDSSPDLFLHNCIIISDQEPRNIPCIQNSFKVSSNGNESEGEAHCSRSFSHETEEGNMMPETDNAIFISYRQKDSNEAVTRTTGTEKNDFFTDSSSENEYCEKVCSESSSTVLSDVINTLRMFYISDSPCNKGNARKVGNENSLSKGKNVKSGKKSGMSQKFTAVQEVSESCNSNLNNETAEMDVNSKKYSEYSSFGKEHSSFSKRSPPINTINCGILNIDNEASQLPLMESTSSVEITSSEQRLVTSPKRLSPTNIEHYTSTHNYQDGDTVNVLTRDEVLSVEKMLCAQGSSSVFKELSSRSTKNCGAYDTSSLMNKSDTLVVRDIVSNSETVPSGQHHSPMNEKSPRTILDHGVLGANSCRKIENSPALRQDNICNSESSTSKQCETLPIFESTQNCNRNESKSSTNVNINDEIENCILNTDVICSQMTRVNTTDNESQFKVLSKKSQAGKKQKLNELHSASCTVTTEQKLRETQSNMMDRKRRNDSLDIHGKKTCTEKQNLNNSIANDGQPCKNDINSADVNMSNSIPTQDLNEAFDSAMNKIAETVRNKQENHSSIVKQDHIAAQTLGDLTVEMDLCKETDEISRNLKDVIDKDTDVKCPDGWEQRLDPKGKIFFVHRESGLTSYTVPNHLMAQNLYSMSKRFAFLPKGMSPILNCGVNKSHKESKENVLTPDSHEVLQSVIIGSHSSVDELAIVKWKDVQEPKESDCRDLVKKLLAESDSRMQFCEKEVPNACIEELPKSIVKVYNVIYPYTFSKDIFSNLKVLGQLDNKFIVTIVGPRRGKDHNLIVLFDQHAVHERIRLETLMKDYLVEGSNSEFRTSEVNPHITLCQSSKEVRILSCFQEDFEKLGLKFEVVDDSSIQVTSVPTCLLAREQREMNGRGVSVLNGFLEGMIREQVDSILTTRGVGNRLPSILQSVISSEACRGAVKFGDQLFPEECEILLKNLADCQVPFQCAHGRPSLVPIVDLQHLQVQQARVRPKPQLWKLKKRLEKPSNI